MKTLLILLAGSLLLGACAQKDDKGQPTSSSFSTTGLFTRSGGDVVIGGN